MKAITEHKAPVSNVDRISFVILPSKFLLHAILLLVEKNCARLQKKRIYFQGESTRKVKHTSGYHEIGEGAHTQIQLVIIDQREDMRND